MGDFSPLQICFVLGLTSLLNIRDHITIVPACSSGTLTNVLPHRNAMPQTQDMTPHLVTVYRHGADLLLCYPLIWNVTLEYTATHFNVLGESRPGNPSATFHKQQQMLNLMLLVVNSRKLSRKYRTNPGPVVNPESIMDEPGTCSVRIHYAIRSPTATSFTNNCNLNNLRLITIFFITKIGKSVYF